MLATLVLALFAAGCTGTGVEQTAGQEITITDGFGRSVTVPSPPQSAVCSGSGGLRYLVYLQSQDLAVGVDDIEKRINSWKAAPTPSPTAHSSKTSP